MRAFASPFAARLAARARRIVESPPGQLAPLDALRALAITMVFGAHYAGEFDVDRPGSLPSSLLRALELGWSGVDLFFVLSGLLIGRQLWTELRTTGTVAVPRFLLRRGLRIWPLYFTFVVLMALVHADQPLRAALPDALFYSNYVQGQVSGGWSLSTEEQFYIVVPLLLLALVRPLGARGAAVAIVALLGAMPLSRWLALSAAGWPALDQSAITTTIYTPIHTHADGLLVGVLIAWAWVHGGLRSASLRDRRVQVVLLFAVVAAATLRAVQNDLYSFLALALVFGVAVVVGLVGGEPVQRLCRPRAFAVVARLSFGMYLNHELLLVTLGPATFDALAPLGTGAAFVGGTAALYALSAAIAAATNVFIEQPGLEWRDRWIGARRESRSAATAANGAERSPPVGSTQAHLYSPGGPARPDR